MVDIPAQIDLKDTSGQNWASTDLLAAAAQWASGKQSLLSKVYEVGDQAPWMYPTVHEAIAAVNADNAASGDPARRTGINVHPGLYLSNTPYLVPARCVVFGDDRFTARFLNSTTEVFIPQGDHVAFTNLLIEGSPTAGLVAFNLNNVSNVHLTFVDMLGQGGAARQLFLLQTGTTWATLLMQHCIVDGFNRSDTLVKVQNTAAGNSRDVDTHFNDCFVDALALDGTGFGGSFQVRKCHEVNFRGCLIRGNHAMYTGVRIENGGGTGTSVNFYPGNAVHGGPGVAVFGEANTNYVGMNSDLPTSPLGPGTRTLRNTAT